VVGLAMTSIPSFECHTENVFWQLVVAIETAPAFLRSLDQFEDHRQRCLKRDEIWLNPSSSWMNPTYFSFDMPTNFWRYLPLRGLDFRFEDLVFVSRT
jgi:hypothetical protein